MGCKVNNHMNSVMKTSVKKFNANLFVFNFSSFSHTNVLN